MHGGLQKPKMLLYVAFGWAAMVAFGVMVDEGKILALPGRVLWRPDWVRPLSLPVSEAIPGELVHDATILGQAGRANSVAQCGLYIPLG